jgi:magnesium-transporting ATPase (P-type)
MLLVLSANYRLDLGIPADTLIDVSSVIFSIAPAGLFFMILLTYAAGTADLAKIGALVRQARSVESLAQVNVMCFAKGGVLTGTDVEIESISKPENPDESVLFADSRIRQILGDYARSTAVPSPMTRALLNSFEGNQRSISEEAPYMSLYGWSAMVFDESDLRGVYVLGDPDILEPYLAEPIRAARDEEGEEEKGSSLRKTIGRLGGIFKRSKDGATDGENAELIETPDKSPGHRSTEVESTKQEDGVQNPNPRGSEATSSAEREENNPNLFKRVLGRVNRVIRREDEAGEKEAEHQDQDAQQVELIFAYYPELLPIHDDYGTPKLSENLVPLCKLRFSEKVRPESIETINKFAQNEVSIKVFSSDPAEQIATLLKQTGFGGQENIIHGEISGDELAKLTPAQMIHAARDNSIFGQLSPIQAAQVVGALRADNQFVAVLGDGVKDVPALRQADLAISMQTSSQAALSQADIILLEDSPTALQRILDKGQRIVKGLLDILKIYLAQVVYLVLLILAIRVISIGFPYTAAQGTAIATFTITIPAIGLTFWASSGVMNSASLSRILRRFVLPAALTMSTAGMAVYRYFLQTTGDMDYAHLTVTYTLVSVGLVLVIFIKPPGRLWSGGASLTGDWRPTLLVIFLQIAFFITVQIPLAQEYLKVAPLRDPIDYLIIGLVVICWAITLRLAWWVWPLRKVIGNE